MVTTNTAVQSPQGGDGSEEAYFNQRHPLFEWDQLAGLMLKEFFSIVRCVIGPANDRSTPLAPEEKIFILRHTINMINHVPSITVLGLKEISLIARPILEAGGYMNYRVLMNHASKTIPLDTRVIELTEDSLKTDGCRLQYYDPPKTESGSRMYRRYILLLDEEGHIVSLCLHGVCEGSMDQFPNRVELGYVEDEHLLQFMVRQPQLIEHMLYTLCMQARAAMNRANERAKATMKAYQSLESVIGVMRSLQSQPVPQSVGEDLAKAS